MEKNQGFVELHTLHTWRFPFFAFFQRSPFSTCLSHTFHAVYDELQISTSLSKCISFFTRSSTLLRKPSNPLDAIGWKMISNPRFMGVCYFLPPPPFLHSPSLIPLSPIYTLRKLKIEILYARCVRFNQRWEYGNSFILRAF